MTSKHDRVCDPVCVSVHVCARVALPCGGTGERISNPQTSLTTCAGPGSGDQQRTKGTESTAPGGQRPHCGVQRLVGRGLMCSGCPGGQRPHCGVQQLGGAGPDVFGESSFTPQESRRIRRGSPHPHRHPSRWDSPERGAYQQPGSQVPAVSRTMPEGGVHMP